LVGGWGNVGGGVTQIVMGTLLFPLFRDVIFDGDSEKAWRTVCVVPALVAAATGLVVLYTSEDCPEGNYEELKKTGRMPQISAAASFRKGAVNFNTWLLYIQYGCCFGVELTMNNAAASYFVDEFGLSTETASAVASIFGFMNIFARGLGGFVSDKAMGKIGMKGRILTQMMFLLMEGACILIFSLMKDLWSAILMLTIFSIFVQAGEGSTYGIVPYVNPSASGAISGIVGAGGPSGAVIFGLGFLFLSDIQHAYILMGSVVILAGFLSLFINIKGHGGLFFKAPEDEALVAGGGGLVVPEIADKKADKAYSEDGDVEET
jgi:NNP family nitrate/nitrite transporter-like MFS transporter